MEATPGGFLRTALRSPPLPGARLQPGRPVRPPPPGPGRRSVRLGQQVRLVLAHRGRAAGSLYQALSFPEPIGERPALLFDYFTMPLAGSSYSKRRGPVSYRRNSGQRSQVIRCSSQTGKLLSQGWQSHASKPIRRIEVAVDDSPVLVHYGLRKEARYPSTGSAGRIRAMPSQQRSFSADMSLGGWPNKTRPAVLHRTTYVQAEGFSIPQTPRFNRSWSHPNQKPVRPTCAEVWSPDSVFVPGLSTECIMIQRSGLEQNTAQILGSSQRTSLDQQFQGVSLGCHDGMQNRMDHVVSRFNWNQTSFLTSDSTMSNVTEGLFPAEIHALQDQVPSQSASYTSTEDAPAQSASYTLTGDAPAQSASYTLTGDVPAQSASYISSCQVPAQSASYTLTGDVLAQSSSYTSTGDIQAQSGSYTSSCQVPAQSSSYTSTRQENRGSPMTASGSVSVDDGGEWTMETAVSALTHEKVDYVVYGANFIQHECYQRLEAKKELYELDGIGKLVALLSSDEVAVQRAVCGAIRNGVFEENDSKIEVKEHDGLQKLVQLLGQTKDIETKKQLTGLMWNLSSNELLKVELIEKALHPLTASIIIPFSGWPDGDVKSFDVDPDIFYNATGCLRNLSSSSPEGRKQMRECEGLIDSLVLYIQFTIANNQQDDKSTENATCVLHNLAFQLENELPSAYVESLGWKTMPLAQQKSAGCFGARSPKLKEEGVTKSACIEEKRNPQGVEWLWHSLVVRMYLSLIARSTRTCTQEASLGALQNLTASIGPMGYAITEIITMKENGLQHIRRMLHSEEPVVQKAAVSLLRNMARNPRVQDQLIELIVPDLIAILPDVDGSSWVHDDTAAYVCQVLYNLIHNKSQNARCLLKEDGLSKVVALSRHSQNILSDSGKAASTLLYNLWLFRDLHALYKKAGFTKSDFINTRTTKAYHSLRDRKSF
ncbi:plakophilin-2-like [Narcine bancroftii]|uniref:plakophilin-2-like n=1 Tax=Narcine bancroftii TaxID=1343680 RepID=UPI0038317053